MIPDNVPCSVCGEVFPDKAAAAAHMKAEHSDEFEPPGHIEIKGRPEPDEPEAEEKPDEVDLAMVPPELMAAMEKKMDERIDAALVAYLPQVQEAVKGAMEKVVAATAQAAGIPIPGVGEGGVVVGSPVTPMGAALIQWMTKSGGGGSDIDAFIKQANQYKALGDLFNPGPSLTDKIVTSAYIRNLRKLDLVTDKQVSLIDKDLGLE